MKITLAPKPLVDYANARFHGHPAVKAKRAALKFLEQVRTELAHYGDHFLGDEDRAQHQALEEMLEDLRSFLEETDEEVGQADLKSFVDCGRCLMQTLDAFEQERQQLHHVGLAPFDQLLVAGVAHLHGRGTREAVGKRLPFAKVAMKKLRNRLNGCEKIFPDVFMKELKAAAHEVERGLADIELWLNSDRYTKLGAGMTRLHSFADKLVCLAPAVAPAAKAAGAQPLGMAELEMLAQDPEADDFEFAARRFAALSYPSVLAFWEEVRDRLLLSANFAASVRAEIDEAFAELEDAISAEELDCARVAQAAEDVVHGFWFIRERRLSLAPAVGTSLEAAVFVVAGACQGGVADVELEDVVALLRGWAHSPMFSASLNSLEAHLASPGANALLRSLEELLAVARQLPAVLPTNLSQESSSDGDQAFPGSNGSLWSLSA